MNNLHIDFLIETPVEKLLENIDSVFNKLVQEIESYLGLEPIDSQFKVSLTNDKLDTDVFSIGVKRFYENGVLNFCFSRNHARFIPIIALREAYKCFVPKVETQMKTFDIFINQKVAIDLKNLDSIKEWNSIITEKLVDNEFIAGEYDRLENFLKRESTSNLVSPFVFFFEYIRKNVKIITEQEDGFYDTLYDKLRINSEIYDDDKLETIRVISKIFQKVQNFTAMLDYQRYFTDFKKNGFICLSPMMR